MARTLDERVREQLGALVLEIANKDVLLETLVDENTALKAELEKLKEAKPDGTL